MTIKTVSTLLIILFICSKCSLKGKPVQKSDSQSEIACDEHGCAGIYIGPEFINGADIAHQFSNEMSSYVGHKLKELYDLGKFSKVDFEEIIMSTDGMGSGEVVYKLEIPFIRVNEKCSAFTSFDHVGGWNHKPSLFSRKIELSKALLPGDVLNISDLMKTPEGLQEYWIQWRNKKNQLDCLNTKGNN